MIFMKISQNFVKSPLKISLISQISAKRLWHVCVTIHIKCVEIFHVKKKKKKNQILSTAIVIVALSGLMESAMQLK